MFLLAKWILETKFFNEIEVDIKLWIFYKFILLVIVADLGMWYKLYFYFV